MTKNSVAHRWVIDYSLIIGNNQWLINWLPIDCLLITHWFHWCHWLVMSGWIQEGSSTSCSDWSNSHWSETEKPWFWSWQRDFSFGGTRTGPVTTLSAPKTQIGASENVFGESTLGTKITTSRSKRTGRTTKSGSVVRRGRGKGKFGSRFFLFLLQSFKLGFGPFLGLFNFWGVRFIVG